MAQNPLLGNKISLISKKNIRYEGTLYSINEANATVALQNVKSYGTEGREKTDPDTAYVAPQEGIHAYLLFRGCDIKDLHVHETPKPPEPPAEAAAPPPPPPAADTSLPAPPPPPAATAPASGEPSKGKENQPSTATHERGSNNNAPKQQQRQANNSRRGGATNSAAQVGTGASLLNRKARGSVQGGPGPESVEGEFDFQAKLNEFDKESDPHGNHDEEDDEAGDEVHPDSHYEKDDFFDSISCDALDRQQGIDNRLRGAQERNLNTETFGAVALNSQRRRRGRGYGRGGGRGGGRGRGRSGRGRGGRGRGRYNNNNNQNNGGGNNRNSNNKAPLASATS